MKRPKKSDTDSSALLAQVRACRICAPQLPLAPKPIFQFDARARILIASQAPGRKAHVSGIPFDDVSGVRLRQWLGVSDAEFYDASRIAIVPMGLCFPGTGRGGDLPPRSECAAQWRAPLLAQLPQLQLTLVIGRYAIDWHLQNTKGKTLTACVAEWRTTWPTLLPMPHPSPRNQRWLANNAWFGDDVLPLLRQRVRSLLDAPSETRRQT